MNELVADYCNVEKVVEVALETSLADIRSSTVRPSLDSIDAVDQRSRPSMNEVQPKLDMADREVAQVSSKRHVSSVALWALLCV